MPAGNSSEVNRPEVNRSRTVKAVAVRFPDGDGYPEYAEPGTWERIDAATLVSACPGCGRVQGMHVGNPKPGKSPSWLINPGPSGQPTLEPSVDCSSCCGWHGYLVDGVWKPYFS